MLGIRIEQWVVWTVMKLVMFTVQSSKTVRSTPGVNREYCLGETFQASCAEDEVIMMHSARYGRMELGRCVQTDFGFLGCSSDVLRQTDKLCSGRRHCSILVPQPLFEATKPCNKEFKLYLEANYSCVRVATAQPHFCQESRHLKVTSKFGYIANLVTTQTRCGGEDTPWSIQVPTGQRINLTLFNFNWDPVESSQYTFAPLKCDNYAVVREEGQTEGQKICPNGGRSRTVYSSTTNKVQVNLFNRQPPLGEDKKHFLIRYQAIGCADPEPPSGGYITRNGDSVRFGCNDLDDRIWHWVCIRNKWTGIKNNCSEEPLVVPSEQMGFGILALPIGTAVSLIVGVAVGVSLVILIIGMIAIKGPHRRRRRQSPDDHDHQNILLKSPPIGSGFKIEYCTPVLDASTEHVCAATLSRQSRASLNLTDVDYAYRWEDPVGVCAHSLDKIQGPTYCTAPIKYTKNDYATWGTGSSGMNPLLASNNDENTHHEGCADLSTGQPLNKPAHCLPSGSDTFRLDLGYGPCVAQAVEDSLQHPGEGNTEEHHCDAVVDDSEVVRYGSSDLCRVDEESEGCEETDELAPACQVSQGPDIQNRLNSILQNMTANPT